MCFVRWFLLSLSIPLSAVWAHAADFSNLQPVLATDTPEQVVAKAAQVIPTPRQMDYHRREFIGFIHFGPNTFSGREWGSGMEDPASFAPAQVDTDDWCRHMKAAGMTLVVMTFKHHDGYVLWQSRYENHQTIRNSPYQNGKGDIARELSRSCAKFGLKFGIYISPADLYQIESPRGLYGNASPYRESAIPTDPAAFHADPGKVRADRPAGAPVFRMTCDDYNRYMLNQLYELLTDYGPVHEVWFDGAHPKQKGGQKYTYQDWYALIRKLAPEALIFGKGPDIRWCGNEAGATRDTEWNVLPMAVHPDQCDWPDLTDKDLGSRARLAGAKFLYYLPAETNTSIRHGWFFRNDTEQTVRSADDVFDIYERSVGGNSVFMLNVPPNREGRFSKRDADCLIETGRRIRATYGVNLAEGAKASATGLLDQRDDTFWQPAGESGEITVQLAKAAEANRFVIQEAIALRGQRVEKHALDAWVEGSWKEVATGTTIGYKKILRFAPVVTDRFRLRIQESRLSPAIAGVSVHFHAQPPLPVRASSDAAGLVTLSLDQPKFTGKGAGFESAGLRIHYTTDGSDPTMASPVYQNPVPMPDGGTLKARSFAGGQAGSLCTRRIGIPRSGWKVSASSEHDATYGAAKAVDGDPATFWHTRWDDPPSHPHRLAIDLGKTRGIAGITYLPRQDKRVPDSMIEAGIVEVSDDGTNWTEAGSFVFGNLLNDPAERTFLFPKPVRGSHLRLVSTRGVAGKPYAGAAEIGVLAP